MQSVATHSADYNAADVADDTAAYPAAASLPFAARSSLFTFRFPPSSFVLPPSVPSLIHSVHPIVARKPILFRLFSVSFHPL
ncbi:MAG: hypothetical protein M9928_14545 [Anaerolineae bacterium]|nr:hypothetical protein [Anaerolineae bacterium]